MTYHIPSDPLIRRFGLLVAIGVVGGAIGYFLLTGAELRLRAPTFALGGVLCLVYATVEAYALGRLPDPNAFDGLATDRVSRQLRAEVQRVKRATLADSAVLSVVGAVSLSFASSLDDVAGVIGARFTWAAVAASLAVAGFGFVAALVRAQMIDSFAKKVSDERRRLERRVQQLEAVADMRESLDELKGMKAREALPFTSDSTAPV